MNTIESWKTSILSQFYKEGEIKSIEHIDQTSGLIFQLTFETNNVPPDRTIQTFLPGLTSNDIKAFVDDARSKDLSKITITATCQCFQVCDPRNVCRTVCYICYPPPAARCCCPGMCP